MIFLTETKAARLKARGRCCDYPASKPHKICYFRDSLSQRLAEIALVILVPIVIIMIGLS